MNEAAPGEASGSNASLGRLSTVESWTEIWDQGGFAEMPRLSRARGFGRDLDRAMQRHLRGLSGDSLLEIGCYPGRFLRFFADFFGMQVDGVEYVAARATECQEMLARAGHPGTIHPEDVFHWQPGRTWDVVASFGFVEHFEDTRAVLARHVQLASPGGLVVVTFPDHHGLYGWIMSKVSPEHYAMHNQMSRAQAVEAAGSLVDADLVESAHIGRIGFGASRLHEWSAASGRLVPRLLSLAARCVERAGFLLPNSPILSPHVLLVIRRKAEA